MCKYESLSCAKDRRGRSFPLMYPPTTKALGSISLTLTTSLKYALSCPFDSNRKKGMSFYWRNFRF